jgi:hypothetical protein
MRLLALFLVSGCLTARAAEAPRTMAIDADGLVAARTRTSQGDGALMRQLAELRADAERLLEREPASVMDKTATAASGDRHDYFSLAPYWWPDAAKPDGRPYVRHDGRVNPESRNGTDSAALARTCNSVRTLGMAYWFTRDERHAQKAAELTRTWFLTPATRMNPHLEYAQAIPGITHGRGTGIIEARHLVSLNDGIALLAGSPFWTADDSAGLQGWESEYHRWLTSSANGLAEGDARNNHGSWYDVQAAGIALALGRTDDARRILAAVPAKRIARQIEPDGSQPLELARTRSLGYSLFNLEALMLLDRLGRQVDLDLWSFATTDGRSLRAALSYLAPYADPARPWPKQDLDAPDRARLLPLLAAALEHGDDVEFRELSRKFGASPAPGETWRLWLAVPQSRRPRVDVGPSGSSRSSSGADSGPPPGR